MFFFVVPESVMSWMRSLVNDGAVQVTNDGNCSGIYTAQVNLNPSKVFQHY